MIFILLLLAFWRLWLGLALFILIPTLIIGAIIGIGLLIYYNIDVIMLVFSFIISAILIIGAILIGIVFLYYIYTKILSLKNYHPKIKDELKELIEDEINLKDIDTRFITDMSELFKNSTRSDFKGLKYWDVSNVKNMASMLEGCENFNQDLSNWDISKVKNMDFMFENCVNFNQDLSNWDTSKVDYMHKMFRNCHKLDKSIAQK
ncbi:BspA family leucine-rich repeat surface protein [Campylobacter lari]|nr:BspA family leucine-rich repeat surface protein [Campylobacter lari]